MRVLASVSLIAILGVAPAVSGARVGAPAPALGVTTLAGVKIGRPGTTGNVTVLNFWATWCPPCRAETPAMIAAYAALAPHGVAFLGIDTTETAPVVKTFVSAKGVRYPVALAGPRAYNAYGITYIPTTIVLDANGIVRARWIGEITPAQLEHDVAEARAGRSAVYLSPVQSEIDGLLAPARYRLDGSPAARGVAVAAAKRAVMQADALAGRAHAQVDYERTSREEGALLVAAGAALLDRAASVGDKIDGLSLTARGDGALDRWDAAAHAEREALGLAPSRPQLVAELSRAYYRLHDYAQMITQAQRYVRLMPADGDGWSELGLAYQRARLFRAAVAPYRRSLSLLQTVAAAKRTQDAFADVADTALDAADVSVSLGDAVGARSAFRLANAYADRLAADGDYATLKQNVKERTQEGLVAVALVAGAHAPVVSVVPWTGPDLPGSLASTLKYRLIVAAPANASVTLRAQGLRRNWIASFCADGLCSPQSVSFTAPPTGVKTYEFQLIPPHDGERPGPIAITVGGGTAVNVPPAAHAR